MQARKICWAFGSASSFDSCVSKYAQPTGAYSHILQRSCSSRNTQPVSVSFGVIVGIRSGSPLYTTKAPSEATKCSLTNSQIVSVRRFIQAYHSRFGSPSKTRSSFSATILYRSSGASIPGMLRQQATQPSHVQLVLSCLCRKFVTMRVNSSPLSSSSSWCFCASQTFYEVRP